MRLMVQKIILVMADLNNCGGDVLCYTRNVKFRGGMCCWCLLYDIRTNILAFLTHGTHGTLVRYGMVLYDNFIGGLFTLEVLLRIVADCC